MTIVRRTEGRISMSRTKGKRRYDTINKCKRNRQVQRKQDKEGERRKEETYEKTEQERDTKKRKSSIARKTEKEREAIEEPRARAPEHKQVRWFLKQVALSK